jgi:hypothetical protein
MARVVSGEPGEDGRSEHWTVKSEITAAARRLVSATASQPPARVSRHGRQSPAAARHRCSGHWPVGSSRPELSMLVSSSHESMRAQAMARRKDMRSTPMDPVLQHACQPMPGPASAQALLVLSVSSSLVEVQSWIAFVLERREVRTVAHFWAEVDSYNHTMA